LNICEISIFVSDFETKLLKSLSTQNFVYTGK
jgi:hypothetical protein